MFVSACQFAFQCIDDANKMVRAARRSCVASLHLDKGIFVVGLDFKQRVASGGPGDYVLVPTREAT